MSPSGGDLLYRRRPRTPALRPNLKFKLTHYHYAGSLFPRSGIMFSLAAKSSRWPFSTPARFNRRVSDGSAIERAELVVGILQSLDATDPNLDQLWAEEAKDRLAAYRRGELEALDFDETLAKLASPP